jgi:hypothetical protein
MNSDTFQRLNIFVSLAECYPVAISNVGFDERFNTIRYYAF